MAACVTGFASAVATLLSTLVAVGFGVDGFLITCIAVVVECRLVEGLRGMDNGAMLGQHVYYVAWRAWRGV